MAQNSTSRELPATSTAAPPPSSLADVIEQIQKDARLSKRQRGDLTYAVNRLAAAFGRPPKQIPAQPHVISRQRRKIVPAAIGMTSASWSNVGSLALKAFELTGCYVHPGKFHAPLSPTWDGLSRRIGNKHLRDGLSRFFHVASDQGWAPEDITEVHFERYHNHLCTKTMAADPDELCRLTRQNWNRAGNQTPAWPGKPVSVPGRRRTRAPFWLRWSDLPATLNMEVQQFLAARAEFDLFKEGAGKPLAPRTIETNEEHLRAYVSALARIEPTPARPTSLRDLVDPETVRTGLRFFLNRKEGKTSAYTSGIAKTIFTVARYLADPERALIDGKQLDALHAICKRVHYRQKAITTKNKELLRLFTDPVNVAKILFLPARLVRNTRPDAKPTIREAQRVQRALALELLLVFPIREDNLTSLHIKKNIVRTGPHKGAKVLIVISDGDVKNGQDLEAELPDSAVELLDLYLDRYRPLLVRDGGDWLFPGEEAGHKHPVAFGTQLKRVIYRETGLPVNVHFFRHLAAKLWLDRHPGQFETMQKVLGHTSTKTLLRFYAEFSSIQACALYDDHVLKLRTELAYLAAPPRARLPRRR